MIRYYVPVEGIDQEECRLTLHIPEQAVQLIRRRQAAGVELGIDDGRFISTQQRKKIYATLRDVAEYTGYTDEAIKEIMKVEHMMRVGGDYFSLSDCTMTTAREFINTLMEYALKEGVILAESGLQRTDDIDTYLMQCIRYRKCCICGRQADIHHVDTIGMGNNRKTYDDSQNRIIALCRQHHQLYHQRGDERFCNVYKVYGIEKYRVKDYTQQDGVTI